MALRGSEHTNSLVDEVADAIVLVSNTDEVLFWSVAAERIFGYTRDEALGRALTDLIVPPDLVDERHEQARRARETGTTLYESVRRRKDGRTLIVSVAMTAVPAPDGGLDHLVLSHRDVTLLTYRRDAALLSATFRGLLEGAPDSMIVVNQGGHVLLANNLAQQMFGYERDELLGQPIELLMPTRMRAVHRKHRDGYAQTPRTRPMHIGMELCGLRKDGTEFPVEVSLSPLETDLGMLTVSAIRDITERKRAEARFRALLEAAPDAMVIVDAGGGMVLVNAQTENLFGYSRNALLGQPVEMLVPERFRAAQGQHRGHYFSAPQPRAVGVELDLYGLRQDGTEFPVEVSLSPLESEDGLLTIAAVRDVTQQRVLAARARQLADEQAARSQAEEAARTRMEFLSVAAHELKTPVTSLRVFADLLLHQLRENAEIRQERLRTALEMIGQQADKLSRLINQLLDMSRIEAGRLGLSREMQDVMPLIRTSVEAAAATTNKHVIALHAPERAVAYIDGLRLEQVLTNLLDNAIKYSPDGGEIDLTVKADDPRMLELSIQDHGIGIPHELEDQVFERFYRVDEKSAPSGLGLGLYISRQILELHQGDISMTSTPGQGTRFTVTLPRQPHDA